VQAGKYFQYYPKGNKTGGQLFSNIQAVKNTLEEEHFDEIGPVLAIQARIKLYRAQIAEGTWTKEQSIAAIQEAYDHSHISACAIDLAAHSVIAFGA
jgi:hypothetical protein